MIKVTTDYDGFIVDITAMVNEDDKMEITVLQIDGVPVGIKFLELVAPEFIEHCDELIEEHSIIDPEFDEVFNRDE
jgi:hypothetical protein